MKETTQFVLFLSALSLQIHDSSTDGDGLNFADAGDFLDEFISAPEAIEGIKLIPAEVRESTHEEREELYFKVAQDIKGMTPEKIDRLIDVAVVVATGIDSAIGIIKEA